MRFAFHQNKKFFKTKQINPALEEELYSRSCTASAFRSFSVRFSLILFRSQISKCVSFGVLILFSEAIHIERMSSDCDHEQILDQILAKFLLFFLIILRILII